MAAIAPVLNGTTLPHPRRSGYKEEVFYKGTVRRMASGALVRELMTSSRKVRFTLEWSGLTVTQRNNVETALVDLQDGTSRSFTSPRNISYTVVLAEDGEPKWDVFLDGAGTFYFSGSMTLEEV